MSGTRTGESMLSRHLRILDVFGVDSAFLTLSQISRRSGLPVSTTHRLLDELERERLVERLPDRSYRLGLRLWELAARTPGALGLREIALPMMQGVQGAIRQHTQLGVRDGRDVVYLERLSHRDAVVSATVVGGRISLAASAIGHVLLSALPEEALADLFASGIPRYTKRTPQTLAEVVAAVTEVRARGHAIADGLVHPDARGIAVPVRGPEGEIVAGLGVVVPNDGRDPRPVVAVLRRAAVGIEESLRRAYVAPGHPHALAGARYRPLINSSTSSMEYFDERGRAGQGRG